jgi:hypothetical protein
MPYTCYITTMMLLLLVQLQVEGLLRTHMREQLSSGSAEAVESEVQRFMRLLDADEDESLDIDEVITLTHMHMFTSMHAY